MHSIFHRAQDLSIGQEIPWLLQTYTEVASVSRMAFVLSRQCAKQETGCFAGFARDDCPCTSRLAQISALAHLGFDPMMSSGAIHGTDPISGRVSLAPSCNGMLSKRKLHPKSASLMMPSADTSIFAALRSPWIIKLLWRYSTPRSA